jgi:hypothetical protein
LFQSYENALDNLDEEGKAELYSSILALLSKESVNNLDLLEEESAEQEEEEASLKEAGETEVADVLSKPLREPDAAKVPHDRQLIPETSAPAVINKSAADESLRSVAACVGPAVESAPLYNVRSAADRPRVEPTEPEEDADIETKKLLEEAAAESFAKR